MSLNSKIEALLPLRDVIAAFDLRAKKSLGQNFLLDLNLTRKIARTAGDLSQTTILEIGPGPGGLTRALFLEGAQKVIAIEQDRRAVEALQSLKQASEGRLEIINGDALAYDYASIGKETRPLAKLSSDSQVRGAYGTEDRSVLNIYEDLSTRATKQLAAEGEFCKRSIKIIANLPYNISTVLLIKWLQQASLFSSLTLMFQKEVADRLTASVGTPSYGRLSIITQWRTHIRSCFDIPPSAFVPAPKVTSTVVHIVPRAEKELVSSFSALEAVTKAAFGQRRKMIRSSLKSLWGAETPSKIRQAGLNPEDRAEDIPLEGYVKLALLK